MPREMDPKVMKLFIWLRLALATAYNLYGTPHARAACLLVDVAVVVGCGLLATLVEPFLATLGALLGILDDDVLQSSLGAARGCAKLGRLGADGVMCGDVARVPR
jgi:hypothetical protein